MPATFVFTLVFATIAPLGAQRRPPGSSAEPALPMKVALQVGGQAYAFTGQGVCQSSSNASIYELPATMYSVRQNDSDRSLSLTLWHPKNGTPDMLNLSVSTGRKSHTVSTVKVGQNGDVKGSGRATFAPAGAGGTFTLDATADSGAKITGTITCDRFAGIVAEGGD
jgi:hypothetical protein